MESLKQIGAMAGDMLEKRLQETGEKIAELMRQNLTAAGHVRTGALRDSIRSETSRDGNTVTTLVYADAQSDDGAYYAEFIEYGTGAAHGRAGGRVGTWRYKDSAGNWHTTDGMDADPFIEPALDDVLPGLDVIITGIFNDIIKYGRGRNS